jgi:hypothetical protein
VIEGNAQDPYGDGEARYVVETADLDPDKHEVRTGVGYVRASARLRGLARDYAAMLRRLSGSESVRAWSLPASDGRGGDVHAVVDSEALAVLVERVRELEKRAC